MAGRHLDTRGRSVIQASSYLALNALLASGVGFVFWTLLSRTLEPSQVGLISTLTTTAPVIATIASFGLPDSLIRFMPDSKDIKAFFSWVLLTVTLAAFAFAGAWLVIQLLTTENITIEVSGLTYSISLTVLVLSIALDTLALAVLVAKRKSFLVLLETVITSPLKVLAALTLHSTTEFILAISSIAALGFCISLICVLSTGLSLRKPVSHRKLVTKFAFSNWISTSVSLIPKATLTVLVGTYLGLTQVAWITVPMLILTALNLPASTLSRGLFAEGSLEPNNLKRIARRTFITATTVTALGAGAVAVLAPFILGIFGPLYVINSTAVLQIFCLASVLAVPNYVIDTILNIRKDTSGYMIVNVGGSVAILIAICVAVPFGVTDAAWGWVIGQFCYGLLACIMLVRKQHKPT